MDMHGFGPPGSDAIGVVALVHGAKRHVGHAAVVRFHSACFTGDVLGSMKCDCGPQLHAAIDTIARSPWGIVIYFLDHEGRGIGLKAKMRAYSLQDEGFDTESANTELHEGIDTRDYSEGIAALKHLGVTKAWLLTNNPEKFADLQAGGITVAGTGRVLTPVTRYNRGYLQYKQARFHHRLNT